VLIVTIRSMDSTSARWLTARSRTLRCTVRWRKKNWLGRSHCRAVTVPSRSKTWSMDTNAIAVLTGHHSHAKTVQDLSG